MVSLSVSTVLSCLGCLVVCFKFLSSSQDLLYSFFFPLISSLCILDCPEEACRLAQFYSLIPSCS